MNNIIKYKGYHAKVEYSVEDNVWYGTIQDVFDLVSFACEDTSKIQQVFEQAVDDFLDFAKSLDKREDGNRIRGYKKTTPTNTACLWGEWCWLG